MSDHVHRRSCTLPQPYPKPEIQDRNPYYATLLLEDYAGLVSETTAVHQYLYHHFTLHRFPELAEVLECIAIVEMRHMELLAETISLLGISPEFRTLTTNIPTYWSASFVYYGIDVHDKLSADIASEQQAIHYYRYHQQLIADPHIRELLDRIILDEEFHLQLFQEAANHLDHY